MSLFFTTGSSYDSPFAFHQAPVRILLNTIPLANLQTPSTYDYSSRRVPSVNNTVSSRMKIISVTTLTIFLTMTNVVLSDLPGTMLQLAIEDDCKPTGESCAIPWDCCSRNCDNFVRISFVTLVWFCLISRCRIRVAPAYPSVNPVVRQSSAAMMESVILV